MGTKAVMPANPSPPFSAEALREQADFLRAGRLPEFAAMLDYAADLQEAQTQTCETCQWAGQPDDGIRECFSTLLGTRPVGTSTVVPLTINGQPFGCKGYQPRP